MSSTLINALQDAQLYDHPVDKFETRETHISHVLLTGSFAYKIKKPLNFGFLDFSELSSRRFYCEEEVRLNRRLAPDLYLGVVPITGSPERPILGGDGEPFEYAVKMRQFDSDQMLDNLNSEGLLTPQHIDELAELLARFHAGIPLVDQDSDLGTPEAVLAPMAQNFAQSAPLLSDPDLVEQLEALEAWTQSTYERLEPVLEKRRASGAIRECHGDLHLGNITLYKGHVTVFDCIEFNPGFRWIDTINDLAFLLMDLEDRKLPHFASRLLNRYLELTGDFQGVTLLPFYKAYRAMVRAKIALLTMGNDSLDDTQRAALLDRYRGYANLAESYTGIPDRFLLAMHGFSGSGKSVISLGLSEELGLVRLRSDVERKRLYGLSPEASSRSKAKEGIYSAEATQRTYDRLAALADQLLSAGCAVVVDAACLRNAERACFEEIAENQGVPFLLIACETNMAVLKERVSARAAAGKDASEANLDILQRQQDWLEPLTDIERRHLLHVDTSVPQIATELARRIRARLGA
ncbi:bifunctional aminoglycoside phosphotransferase/ATP-binding protein [Mangrovitalea sediminis]|uniref:bifunctional aminoglycoside phosphotransferase/ATP-binding protein n=1 Tax=Mangrovitalea sediminis TaxID=1982043 RepID=UPI001D0D0C28|nr:bifunctional aminoglycoside phosphotransferase/ATP-binding protein [Mangrovitalea sediminis]